MHAEFADQRIEGRHLGRMVGRHPHRLLRGEDVEFAGIEDQLPALAQEDRFPEVGEIEPAREVDVDDPGVALGPVAQQAHCLVSALAKARKVDRNG